MPRIHLHPALAPRDGRALRAVGITRISTVNQDLQSLADQQALLRNWLSDRYDGPVEWTFIEGQGSGESVDRRQVTDAEELASSGQVDLIIMEDLARHMRRVHAVLFCEECEDSNTRLIAINDGIDTGKDWRLHAFFAAIKHEQSNKDTSLRIKRSLRNRFVQGGIIQFTIFGYIKPPGAKTDAELQKDPAAVAIFEEWFRRLDNGETFSEIADWLNALVIPVGPFCQTKRWTRTMVSGITRNPILKGVRVRNRMESKRLNKTGRHKSVAAAPENRLERYCEHLAFFEAAYYDRVVGKVNARNAKYRRTRDGAPDPCANRPKKRVRYPGQSIRCGICGRPLVFGAHGQADHLMCSGAKEYLCWNGISLSGSLTAALVAKTVLAQIETLEDFDTTFVELINQEAHKRDGQREQRRRDLETSEEQCQRGIQNLLKFLRDGHESPSVASDLVNLESQLRQIRVDIAEVDLSPSDVLDIPPADQLRKLARELISELAVTSYDFAKLMRDLVTDFFVYPYRSCDGRDFVLRGTARLQLAQFLPSHRLRQALGGTLDRRLELDLYVAPRRIRCREEVMALREQMTQTQVATHLGITETAAQRAAQIDRLMKRLGIDDPYIRLTEPPNDYRRMRRHLHPRYRFDPLPGFGGS